MFLPELGTERFEMADVVWLEPDEKPPEDADWALVAKAPGGYSGSGSVQHGGGATFYVPYPQTEADQAAAIEKAVVWADKHGVKTVYVVR
jgi:hypothetical protein